MKEVDDRQSDQDEFQNLEINDHRPTRHTPSRPGFNEMFNGFPDFNSFKIWYITINNSIINICIKTISFGNIRLYISANELGEQR